MHGGKSRASIVHPNFKHGFYSGCVIGIVLRAEDKEARRIARVVKRYRDAQDAKPMTSREFQRRFLRYRRTR